MIPLTHMHTSCSLSVNQWCIMKLGLWYESTLNSTAPLTIAQRTCQNVTMRLNCFLSFFLRFMFCFVLPFLVAFHCVYFLRANVARKTTGWKDKHTCAHSFQKMLFFHSHFHSFEADAKSFNRQSCWFG